MSTIWILIFAVATSTSSTGSAAVAPEFTSYAKCMAAGTAVAADVKRRQNHTVTLVCVEK